MAYRIVVTYPDGRTKKIETESRAKAFFTAEQLSCPVSPLGLFPAEGRDVELLDSEGVRLLDSSVPEGSIWAVAWRDSRRTWVRGYLTREEAEAAKGEIPAESGAVILGPADGLPWGQEPTPAVLRPEKRKRKKSDRPPRTAGPNRG